MKLAHYKVDKVFEFDDFPVYEWVIESETLFLEYVQELYRQSKGVDGAFILSETEKELDFEKNVEMVMNPLELDCNDKKILTKLYTQLEEIAIGEKMHERTQSFFQEMQNYMLQLDQESEYILDVSYDIDVANFLKAMKLKLEMTGETFLEKIATYMKLVHHLLKKKLMIFVHLRSYLTEVELIQLLELAKYLNVSILLIESSQKSLIKGNGLCIIDADRCEIC